MGSWTKIARLGTPLPTRNAAYFASAIGSLRTSVLACILHPFRRSAGVHTSSALGSGRLRDGDWRGGQTGCESDDPSPRPGEPLRLLGRRRHPHRQLRRDPEARRHRCTVQDLVPHLHLRGRDDRGRGLRRPRRHVHQRPLSAGDGERSAADGGRLGGRRDARQARRVNRLRRRHPLRPHPRRGRNDRRRRRGHAGRARPRGGVRRARSTRRRRANTGGAAMIGIGVLGYGYWGPNLVRNFAELPDSRVVKVSDLRPDRLALVRQRYPTIETTTDYADLLADPTVDAVAIATPVSTHFEFAMQALKAGKHVLIEKPMAASTDEALQLIDEAERVRRVLMVDHTFVYTGAVRRIQELIASKSLGTVNYYDSVRVNLGLFQHDVNVIWDLAVHDLAIMDYVLPMKPCAVTATGMSHLPGRPENIAYLTLFFETNMIAHVNVNWLAPVKIRRTLIGGTRRMIVYDDLEPSEKIKVYDKGITVNNNSESLYKLMVGYRTGDMWAPQLDTTEALRTQALHFIRSIEDRAPVITDGDAGLRVVSILEAATQSINDRGRLVELTTNRVPA